MSRPYLDRLFAPRSVALIGASRDKTSVGFGIAENLVFGAVMKSASSSPFEGDVFFINPHADEILGRKCLTSILKVPKAIDLAVIAVPAKVVPAVLEECGKKKVPFAIIISAGFNESGGDDLSDLTMKVAKRQGIRLIGPNCLGLLRPQTHLNASFAPSMPKAGPVAFISQSGALADSVIDWALDEGYGFSGIVSIGNALDLGFADLLEFFSQDPHTKVITLYIEGLHDGRRFYHHLKAATAKKPVVILKAGRTAASQKAIGSHTASLSGDFAVFTAAIEQAGGILVDSVEDLFDMGKALAWQPPLRHGRVAIVTNAGGPGVVCADWCSRLGLEVVPLEQSTIKKLDATKVMSPAYSRSNPLDLVGDALPHQYEAVIMTFLGEKYIDGIIVIQTIQTMTQSLEDAMVVVKAKQRFPDKPIICLYMGGRFSRKAIHLLEAHGIPDYNDPRNAALAMHALFVAGSNKKRR
ncbi:hypothetical protein COV94_00225 [Candidatus Woesearchaeota archaeon CG11_big_fil_rev_8_21_14_0_20_57_5]|nr:MAG: hypothetical protein COV94_00225 [Candidatus Woesearchaeota archaeon CG11_big_fil_rev_8_21_14_0_20_57_5]